MSHPLSCDFSGWVSLLPALPNLQYLKWAGARQKEVERSEMRIVWMAGQEEKSSG